MILRAKRFGIVNCAPRPMQNPHTFKSALWGRSSYSKVVVMYVNHKREMCCHSSIATAHTRYTTALPTYADFLLPELSRNIDEEQN